jgi:hypothetical protein
MLSVEEAVKLLEVFKQKHAETSHKFAAFVLPLRDGHIYVGRRNSGYLAGTYSAIGGKVEHRNPSLFSGFDLATESVDLTQLGFEQPTDAAIRELSEELYSAEPDYRMWKACEVVKLGVVLDAQSGAKCFLRTVKVPDIPFRPNPRELSDIARLVDVAIADINPMTRAALLAIRENMSLQEYHAQIPKEIPLVYHQTMREWLIQY